MNLQDVLIRVARIMDCRGDSEAAHSMEDDPYRDLLKAISMNDCDEIGACATAALTTQEIDFDRWCA